MKLRRPKWSPRGPNGAQEAQMELRRPKWSSGGPNGAQEAQMEPRRPKPWAQIRAALLERALQSDEAS